MGKFKNAWLQAICWTFMYFGAKAGSSTFFCCSAIKVFVRVCKCALLHHGCGKSAHFIGEWMRVIIYSQITRWNAVSSQQTCKIRRRVLLHIAKNLKWNIDMFSSGTKVHAKSMIKTSKIDQDEMMLFSQEAEKRAPLSDERCTLVTQSSFDGFATLLIRVFTWNVSLCWNIPRDCVKIHLRKSTHFNGGITSYASQWSITQIDNVDYDGYKTFLLVTLHVYLLYTIRTCVLLHSMSPIGNFIS